jgi:HlyD family secretion protein
MLWVGLGQFSPQVPWASERQAGVPPDHPAAGEVQELRSQVGQPMTILYVAPPGQAVKKGDLLVELDAAALVDQRIQQVRQVRKAESDWIFARETLSWQRRAAEGQIMLAEKALRLAQAQLKAYTEGEYPRQLALAQAAAVLAMEKSKAAEDRLMRLRAQDAQALMALQEAQMMLQEAKLQALAAEGTLANLKSFVHDNKVAELELAVAQKEFELARAKDELARATITGEAAQSFAEMSYEMEKDRLAKMDDQIRQCKLYAPRDGVVAHPANDREAQAQPGAVVRARQLLLRLLPPTATPVKQ